MAALLVCGCLASPPREVHAGDGFRVRADSVQEASEVARLVDGLRDELLGMVPDSRFPSDLEIWVQEQPHLYARPVPSSNEAEGLWAEGRSRILLARRADDVERTLAHELTHAVLGASWRTLPGSLEEGFCDAIAARLCPRGAARLRAGRLSSAALALGGLELSLELRATGTSDAPQAIRARIVLSGEESALEDDDHLGVFRVQAGLSSTRIDASAKRSFYGLSYLLIERAVERIGVAGLHALCVAAGQQQLASVPHERLLAAAGLERDGSDWWRAAMADLGPEELVEIVRMYPDFVVETLEGHLVARSLDEDPAADPRGWLARCWRRLDELEAVLALEASGARVDVTRLAFVRRALEARLEQRAARHRLAQAAE